MKRMPLVLLSVVFVNGSAANAQDATAHIGAIAAQFAESGQFSGTVLVADSSNVLVRRSFGLADQENEVANSEATLYRIASVTKAFTAVLALQSAERGELKLDDPIQTHLPELSDSPVAGVTIDQLLTHMSGITDFRPTVAADISLRDALLRKLERAQMDSAPGTRYAYCNVGYTILGVILESATGRTYEELLRKRIFEPAKMASAYLDVPSKSNTPAQSKARAKGYARSDGAYTLSEEPDLTPFTAAGGIACDAYDLLRFSKALNGDVLMNEALRGRMLANNEGRSRYGCVVRSIPTGDQVEIFQGAMPGASALLLRVNNGKYAIVLLANQSDAPLQPMAQQMLMALLRPR